MTQETKPCNCGKKMIKRGTGIVLLTSPPKYPMQWWCGGCGATDKAGYEQGVNHEDYMKELWEKSQ